MLHTHDGRLHRLNVGELRTDIPDRMDQLRFPDFAGLQLFLKSSPPFGVSRTVGLLLKTVDVLDDLAQGLRDLLELLESCSSEVQAQRSRGTDNACPVPSASSAGPGSKPLQVNNSCSTCTSGP